MYKTTKSSEDLSAGDRVLFVNNHRGYDISSSNPLAGTMYECQGTVVQKLSLETVEVKWDNGFFNTYADHTLALVDNFVISIW